MAGFVVGFVVGVGEALGQQVVEGYSVQSWMKGEVWRQQAVLRKSSPKCSPSDPRI